MHLSCQNIVMVFQVDLGNVVGRRLYLHLQISLHSKVCFMLSVYPANNVNQYTESPIIANTAATDNI